MNIYELSEQICDNLTAHLDELHPELIDGVCQVVVDTINDATFAAAPKGN